MDPRSIRSIMLRPRLSVLCSFPERRLLPNKVIPLSSAGPTKYFTSTGLGKVPHTNPNGTDAASPLNENSMDPTLPPSLYRSGNSPQLTEATRLLKRVEKGFRRTATQRPRYLDVGCGTGNLTREILLKHGGDFAEMVGVDISSGMIDWARQHAPHPRLSYDVLDIEKGDASGFVNKYGKFDRVYSFFCLNWVCDKRRALRNIAVLLGDEGQFLLAFLVRTDLREVWLEIAKSPRWKEYTAVSES